MLMLQSEALVREAYRRGSTDNITALLFDLKQWRVGLENGRAASAADVKWKS